MTAGKATIHPDGTAGILTITHYADESAMTSPAATGSHIPVRPCRPGTSRPTGAHNHVTRQPYASPDGGEAPLSTAQRFLAVGADLPGGCDVAVEGLTGDA